MKYITLFEQQTAFDEAKSTLDKPNMSLVTETGNVYSLTAGGGGYDANILMVSASDYQLYSEEGYYYIYEYKGIEKYKNKDYFKYSITDTYYILAPTRNITKVTFPFDDYYINLGGEEPAPLSAMFFISLYGFTSVPENKILMKPRTDIGTNANGYSYVDLGLTSGTLWATMNVGATSETDHGSYFQWGETEPHDNGIPYDWANYKYNGGTQTLTKYNTEFSGYGGTVDNKITLDLEDDAARAKMGGDWKMPTLALMEELVSETNNVSATINGVNGWKFTSKIDPSKYIFIPDSGRRQNSSLLGKFSGIWSSSLHTMYPDTAWNLSNGDAGDSYLRVYGLPVRGVL